MVGQILRRIVGLGSIATAARRSTIPVEENATRRQWLGLAGCAIASLALPHLGCGEETGPVGRDAGKDVNGDDAAASCTTTLIGLNAQNVQAFGFNGAATSFVVEAGQETLRFTAQSATDPGVAILPKNSNDWITDCPRLRFELKGSIVPSGGGTPRLDVQIYLEGDNPSAPSIPGDHVPLTGDWSSQSVQIPAEFAGRRITKIEPLVVGGTSDVDINIRYLRFE